MESWEGKIQNGGKETTDVCVCVCTLYLIEEVFAVWSIRLHNSTHLVNTTMEPPRSNELGEFPAHIGKEHSPLHHYITPHTTPHHIVHHTVQQMLAVKCYVGQHLNALLKLWWLQSFQNDLMKLVLIYTY